MEKTKLLILRITDRCNLACKYCYAHTKEAADMTPEIAKKAVDLMAKPGDKLRIQFTGGEPLLCKEVMQEVYLYGKQKKISMTFSLQTNGTLLNERTCAWLKELRCAVGVSLDGIGDANRLRVYPDGTPVFKDVLKGIRNLGLRGIYCNINAVISCANQSGLAQLLELAAYLGNVKGLGLDMFRPLGRGENGVGFPDIKRLPEDLKALMEKQEQLADLGVMVKIKELEKVRIMLQNDIQETCYCYAQTGDSVAVDPRGDIYPCSSFVGMNEMCMGNVETGLLKFPEVPRMGSECLSCEKKKICRGGCPAGRAACGGLNVADCIMHQTIIEYGGSKYA